MKPCFSNPRRMNSTAGNKKTLKYVGHTQLGLWVSNPTSDRHVIVVLIGLLIWLGSCKPVSTPINSPTAHTLAASPTLTITPTPTILIPTETPVPTATPRLEVPSATPESTSTNFPPSPTTLPPTPPSPAPASPTSEPSVFYEPAGCQLPPDDYTSVNINGITLSQRTYAMLQYAAHLYGGEIDVAGNALIQDASSQGGSASVEAQSGGGVVDISVIRLNTDRILYTEIGPLVRALRVAGFAAWLRDIDELGKGSKIHIHAVAIGDKELSSESQDQLTGSFGYFRGYSGVPQVDGTPVPDRHGGPVVCKWMIDVGYSDLRKLSQIPTPLPAGVVWQENLVQAASTYLADTAAQADKVARQLHYLDGKTESASLMCGPLAAAILRDAGLLPYNFGPVADLHAYWLAKPNVDGRPWSFFPAQDYELFHFDTPIKQFDFVSWPLRPGDFVYTYSHRVGYEHMFVVTEVDEQGRAYTVTNLFQLDKTYRIQHLMLYDPADPTAGAIQNQFSNPHLGRTGLTGFDVLRRRGVGLPPGSLYAYPVQLGDTLLAIAAKFYTTQQGIAAMNAGADLARLSVGQTLIVPVSTAEISNQPSGGVDFQKQVEEIVAGAPSGQWGVYVENLNTSQVIAVNANESFQPAATIKLAIGMATMAYIDANPGASLNDGPGNRARSYDQLLQAMLIPSEENATATLLDWLDGTAKINVQELVQSWGATHTTFDPLQTTPADLALLWKRLYRGELFSKALTDKLLEILRTPSAGDELRIGAGLPEEARAGMAHKNGITFVNGPGVVADAGVVEAGGTAYVIVVLGNQVNVADYDEAMNTIALISRVVYTEFVR